MSLVFHLGLGRFVEVHPVVDGRLGVRVANITHGGGVRPELHERDHDHRPPVARGERDQPLEQEMGAIRPFVFEHAVERLQPFLCFLGIEIRFRCHKPASDTVMDLVRPTRPYVEHGGLRMGGK